MLDINGAIAGFEIVTDCDARRASPLRHGAA